MKIAIVKLSAMGDIVHAMVALQFVKKAFPNSCIDWIVEEHFSGVLENNPDINAILCVNLKAIKTDKWKFFSELKRIREYAHNNYDIVIDIQGLLKSAIVSKILGSNVGFDKHAIREKIASFLYKKSFFVPYEENVIVRNLDLITFALNMNSQKYVLEKKEPFLYFKDEDKEKTVSFLNGSQKKIIYILGSSWESKVYPKEKFVEVINALEGDHLLVWGDKKEYDYAQYISENSHAQILPHLNLNELKALISSADLVIGGDSGPTHFAWALNRPSITIFGPTPSFRNTLVCKINKVIDCGKEINPLKLDKNDLCIQDIQADKVVAMAKELLQ